jgi:hypothetical protein
MMDLREVEAALRDLHATHRAIGGVTGGQAEGWRLELVRLRRALAEKIGLLSNGLNQWSPPPEAAAFHAALRRDLSALRASLAEHQARWPAVSVDIEAPDHVRSQMILQSAHDALDRSMAALGAALNEFGK